MYLHTSLSVQPLDWHQLTDYVCQMVGDFYDWVVTEFFCRLQTVSLHTCTHTHTPKMKNYNIYGIHLWNM